MGSGGRASRYDEHWTVRVHEDGERHTAEEGRLDTRQDVERHTAFGSHSDERLHILWET